jgi:HEAT repeat protein
VKKTSVYYSHLSASEIVALLEEPTDDRRPLKMQLRRNAKVKELIRALQITKTVLTRRILCDILAERRAKSAVNAILECINDASSDLRNDAVEALIKIRSYKAGEGLLAYFIDNPQLWYAVALGEIGYRPAIPYLMDALENPDEGVREGAAWALGYLGAIDAIGVLVRALHREANPNCVVRMQEALASLSQN